MRRMFTVKDSLLWLEADFVKWLHFDTDIDTLYINRMLVISL